MSKRKSSGRPSQATVRSRRIEKRLRHIERNQRLLVGEVIKAVHHIVAEYMPIDDERPVARKP